MVNKRTNRNVKLVTGTHRKDRDRDTENDQNEADYGQNEVEKPLKRPKFLKRRAIIHWNRLLPLMQEHRLISEIDSHQLARYCLLLVRFEEAEAEIAKNGAVVMMEIGRTRERAGRPTLEEGTVDGNDEKDKNLEAPLVKVYRTPKKNPWVPISKDCFQELLRLERAMRMTNDSNPDLHGKRKDKKGKNGKMTKERFFN